MITFDLRQCQITLEELFRAARSESVLIVTEEGQRYILEAADEFDREVAELGRSREFMDFLAERRKEAGRLSLEEIEQRLKPLAGEARELQAPEKHPAVDPTTQAAIEKLEQGIVAERRGQWPIATAHYRQVLEHYPHAPAAILDRARAGLESAQLREVEWLLNERAWLLNEREQLREERERLRQG